MKTIKVESKTAQTHCDIQHEQATFSMPTHDEIAGRAYKIYIKNGRRQGQCEHNWQQAENDLCTERKASKSSCGSEKRMLSL